MRGREELHATRHASPGRLAGVTENPIGLHRMGTATTAADAPMLTACRPVQGSGEIVPRPSRAAPPRPPALRPSRAGRARPPARRHRLDRSSAGKGRLGQGRERGRGRRSGHPRLAPRKPVPGAVEPSAMFVCF